MSDENNEELENPELDDQAEPGTETETETGTDTDTEAELEQLEDALDETVQDDQPGDEPVDPPAEPGTEPDSEPPAEPDPVDPDDDKPEAAAKPLFSFAETQDASKKARDVRIAQAVDEMVPPADISEEEAEGFKKKQILQDELQKCASKIEKHEKAIDELKGASRAVMAELYPQNVKSDRHVDAVRGYLAASAEERRNRGAHPSRLKELLMKAGMSPVDAAHQRSRARGMTRPSRKPMAQGAKPAADQSQAAQE